MYYARGAENNAIDRINNSAHHAPMVALPSAPGIDDIELGGMMPTSVTTAVMHDGGVKSYNGLKIERFDRGFELCGSPCDVEVGGNGVGAVHKYICLRKPQSIVLWGCSPSSFLLTPSQRIPSANLYVSQHTTTGIFLDLAIIATIAVPARETTAPFAWRECAPTNNVVVCGKTDGRDGKRR